MTTEERMAALERAVGSLTTNVRDHEQAIGRLGGYEEPDTDALGVAWSEVEAALPDGWTMLVGREINRPYSYWATASSPRDKGGAYSIVSTSHDGTLKLTATDAVRELAGFLRERPS